MDGSADRVGGAAAAAVRLEWVQPMEFDENLPPEHQVDWWNTGVATIRNGITSIVRVLNQETQLSQTISTPGGSTVVSWFMPWCNSYDEVTTKALLFRAAPPATPTARGSRLFYIFQDYRSDTVMWLPPGVHDFGMRDPIELTPNSGTFLGPSSVIDLSVVVNPLNGLIVPGAAVVVP